MINNTNMSINPNHTVLSGEEPVNPGNGFHYHCSTGDLMGPLGLLVQGLLAFLAFSSLIAKRYCEPRYERRPWRIWFFDTSKQAFGAFLIHFANVFLADISKGGDPCTWYVVSFLLDSTIGLVVIYIGLKITQFIVDRYKCESLKFGEYGSPPKCNAFIGQCGLYILVMIVEKILMTLLISFHFWKDVRKFIMSPVKDPHVELVLVMFIIPLVVNAFIFWVVDNFLKRKIKGTKTIYVTENDSSVTYHRRQEKAHSYNKIERSEESDLLASTDEEIDIRHRSSSTDHLLS
ncbi:store-operated calcium entry regulator STIMATE-like [Mytilus galloprovincialis]|uniref:Transmembrane protein 110 n=2 Tax=Mytilus galloprovincialis TaxID=29158 RepID=A0A8B6BT13_MYTGA|nr:Hypothetical predicted protein [Mytilus galloprovincialis]